MVRIRRLGVVAGEEGLEGSAGGGALPVGHPGGQSFGQVVDGSRDGVGGQGGEADALIAPRPSDGQSTQFSREALSDCEPQR